jgi:hypothetical protein
MRAITAGNPGRIVALTLVAAGAAIVAVVVISRPVGPLQSMASPSATASLSAVPSSSAAAPDQLPSEIAEMPWFVPGSTGYVVGRLGRGVTANLPEDEVAVASSHDLVVTIDAATRSVIRLRAVDGGALVSSLATDLILDQGEVVGRFAYFAGRAIGTEADLGIWRLSIDNGTWENVLQGTSDPTPSRGVGSRSVSVSRTGAVVASTWCGGTECETSLRAPDGTIATIQRGYVRWVSDRFVLLTYGADLYAYRVDGSPLWKRSGAQSPFGTFLADGVTAVLSAEVDVQGGRYEIRRINAETGDATVLYEGNGDQGFAYQYLPRLSSDDLAVLVSDPSLAGVADGDITIKLLDLRNGTLLAGAYRLSNGSR